MPRSARVARGLGGDHRASALLEAAAEPGLAIRTGDGDAAPEGDGRARYRLARRVGDRRGEAGPLADGCPPGLHREPEGASNLPGGGTGAAAVAGTAAIVA